jgi:hypothetical protein
VRVARGENDARKMPAGTPALLKSRRYVKK